jgi:8-hydroxy-5-deazaflavin:NADPH oxidoreductase
MRIGILGSGLMGGKLGTLFARAGHEVVFSYARSEQKLKRLAQEAGGKARAGTPREAAQEADAVLLAVHWSRIRDVLKQAGRLPGKIIVSCSLFNTVPSEVLFGAFGARRRAVRPSLVYCGDDSRSKGVATGLIRDVGFEPMDLGPLRMARYTEPFALLVARLAYGGRDGPELAYRFEWFGK